MICTIAKLVYTDALNNVQNAKVTVLNTLIMMVFMIQIIIEIKRTQSLFH